MTSRPGTHPDPATGGQHPARRGDLRAADSDQERAAAQLSRHLVDGRLTVEEFAQRPDLASAARTIRDLAHALRELPDLPVPRPTRRHSGVAAGGVDRTERTAVTRHLMVYLLGGCLLILVWLAAGIVRGELGPFWPGWMLLAWGVAPLLDILIVTARAGSPDARAARRTDPTTPWRRAR